MPHVGRIVVGTHVCIARLLGRVRHLAGERRAEVVVAVRRVGDEVLAPAIDDVSPGVGEAVGDEHAQLLGARLVAPDAGFLEPHRAVGRLDLRVEERAFLEVQAAAGSQVNAWMA